MPKKQRDIDSDEEYSPSHSHDKRRATPQAKAELSNGAYLIPNDSQMPGPIMQPKSNQPHCYQLGVFGGRACTMKTERPSAHPVRSMVTTQAAHAITTTPAAQQKAQPFCQPGIFGAKVPAKQSILEAQRKIAQALWDELCKAPETSSTSTTSLQPGQ